MNEFTNAINQAKKTFDDEADQALNAIGNSQAVVEKASLDLAARMTNAKNVIATARHDVEIALGEFHDIVNDQKFILSEASNLIGSDNGQ